MKKLLLLIILSSCCWLPSQAQNWAVKTNAAYLATTTLNLGTEVALSQRMTIEVLGMYNPFRFRDNKKMLFWGVQPELRWWTCRKFSGHFFGLHGHYGQYNAGVKTYRYDGWLAGAGISYGYQFVLGNRWNLELELGVGYARLNYDKYLRECDCGKFIAHETKNYFGPTRMSITFSYFIN